MMRFSHRKVKSRVVKGFISPDFLLLGFFSVLLGLVSMALMSKLDFGVFTMILFAAVSMVVAYIVLLLVVFRVWRAKLGKRRSDSQ